MSVLYCTVPDRVKYSTVLADEYRKVTEKIDNKIIGGLGKVNKQNKIAFKGLKVNALTKKQHC